MPVHRFLEVRAVSSVVEAHWPVRSQIAGLAGTSMLMHRFLEVRAVFSVVHAPTVAEAAELSCQQMLRAPPSRTTRTMSQSWVQQRASSEAVELLPFQAQLIPSLVLAILPYLQFKAAWGKVGPWRLVETEEESNMQLLEKAEVCGHLSQKLRVGRKLRLRGQELRLCQAQWCVPR